MRTLTKVAPTVRLLRWYFHVFFCGVEERGWSSPRVVFVCSHDCVLQVRKSVRRINDQKRGRVRLTNTTSMLLKNNQKKQKTKTKTLLWL